MTIKVGVGVALTGMITINNAIKTANEKEAHIDFLNNLFIN
jgi:hypothetical protein